MVFGINKNHLTFPGFGHDLAVRLDQLGFTVFAGCLYPQGDGSVKLREHTSRDPHVVPLDVGKEESVLAAHDYVVKHLPETGKTAILCRQTSAENR